MKQLFSLLYAAIFFISFTTISLAGDGAGAFTLDAPGPRLKLESNGFKLLDPWTRELSAAGVAAVVGNSGSVEFMFAEFKAGNATAAGGNPSTPVPEPASMFLVGTGLIALAGFGRKKFFKKKG